MLCITDINLLLLNDMHYRVKDREAKKPSNYLVNTYMMAIIAQHSLLRSSEQKAYGLSRRMNANLYMSGRYIVSWYPGDGNEAISQYSMWDIISYGAQSTGGTY